jgi:hypothetical protein
MRAKHVAIGVVVGVLLSAAVVVLAGNLDPPSGPTDAGSQMHSLEAIYDRLDDGTAGTKMTSFTEPASGPGAGTMHTLDDIMDKAPMADNTSGVVPSEVLSGTTYWSLRTDGTWGPQSGAMRDNGSVVIMPTTASQTIQAGYHDGAGYVEGDADLMTGNIRAGVTLFGVAGDPMVVDTSSGDAVAGEILHNRTAWVDGVAVSGTMPDNGAVTIVPTTTNQVIAEGYHDGSGYVAGDGDLVAGNIVSGVVLFGVAGAATASAYGAPVPKTGQTTSLVPGDDGDLQVGVPWPDPRFTANVDNNGDGDCDDPGETCDGTVTDNLTGLIWLKDPDCFGRTTWGQAVGDANGLASAYCGLMDGSSAGDWRLPNIRELLSLVDFSQISPALPAGHPFVNVHTGWQYWSSTTYVASPDRSWYVVMEYGIMNHYSKSAEYRVWPVRGGK